TQAATTCTSVYSVSLGLEVLVPSSVWKTSVKAPLTVRGGPFVLPPHPIKTALHPIKTAAFAPARMRVPPDQGCNLRRTVHERARRATRERRSCRVLWTEFRGHNTQPGVPTLTREVRLGI